MIGTTLGNYKIVGSLGKGAMGVVYRATDLRLGRTVALKVLHSPGQSSTEDVTRFRREAQLLASINHPNIGTIYGIEENNQIVFLILEFVPGITLTEHLRAGRLDVKAALRLCRQIALALEAAHAAGIIHRDLKPDNVKVNTGGEVKVLDFGLAKSLPTLHTEISGVDDTRPGTVKGTILGTPAYMSPEQSRGLELDKRTDIWSFGCVLFETLTGTATFEGATFSDLAVAILEQEPEWNLLPRETPVRIRHLLERCLHKDAIRRLHEIIDARIEIEDALTRSESSPAIARMTQNVPVPKQRRSWMAFLPLGILMFLIPLASWRLGRRSAVHKPTRFVGLRRLTEFIGLEDEAAVSPDGKSLAFVADVAGRRQVWVRLLAGGAPLQLTHGVQDCRYPRWSQSSSSLIYYSVAEGTPAIGTIWEISALGGSPRRLVQSLGEADLSHDDKELAFFRSTNGKNELVAAARDGSNPKVIAAVSGVNSHPRWSPDDRSIAYQHQVARLAHGIVSVRIGGGDPLQIVTNGLISGFGWGRTSDEIVYSSAMRDTMLYMPTYDLWSATLSDQSVRLLAHGETSLLRPDAASGNMVATSFSAHFNVWRFPVHGSARDNVQQALQITQQTGNVQVPSISPDGQEVVYLSDSGGRANLWIWNFESKQARQLTFDHDPNPVMGLPLWSPDGKNIAFVTGNQNTGDHVVPFDLFLINSDGGNRRRLIQDAAWPAWSADGKWVYHVSSNQKTLVIKKSPIDGGAAVYVRDGAAPAPGRTALYYGVSVVPSSGSVEDINGVSDSEIWVAQPENGQPRRLARISGQRIPQWQQFQPILSPDGKYLAILLTDGSTTNIWVQPTNGDPMLQITDFGNRRMFIERSVAWSSDSQSIFAAVGEGDSDIVEIDEISQQSFRAQ